MAKIKPVKGKWQIDYTDETGRRRRVSFTSKKDAQDSLREIEFKTAVRRGHAVSDSAMLRQARNMTILEIYGEYEKLKIGMKERLTAQKSARANLSTVLREFGPLRVSHLTPRHILNFQARMIQRSHLSKTTCHEYLTRLKTLLNWAVKNGLISENPIANVKLENGKSGSREHLEQPEIELFAEKLANEDPEMCDYFLMGVNTGMRINELWSLEWSQVDLRKCEIHLPATKTKTGAERTVPLNHTVMEILRRRQLQRGGNPYVFWHPYRADYVSERSRRLSKRFLPKKVHTPHHWRVTFATRALAGRKVLGADGKTYYARADIKTVAEVGGWEPNSAVLMKVYQRVEKGQKQACVDLVDTGQKSQQVNNLTQVPENRSQSTHQVL